MENKFYPIESFENTTLMKSGWENKLKKAIPDLNLDEIRIEVTPDFIKVRIACLTVEAAYLISSSGDFGDWNITGPENPEP